LQNASIDGYRCQQCDWRGLSLTRICPKCRSTRISPGKFKGSGRIVAFTKIRYPPADFQGKEPYTVVLAELDEGIRLMARLDGHHPNARIGDRIEVWNTETDSRKITALARVIGA
jgi:uncharacterized OB-fold protein